MDGPQNEDSIYRLNQALYDLKAYALAAGQRVNIRFIDYYNALESTIAPHLNNILYSEKYNGSHESDSWRAQLKGFSINKKNVLRKPEFWGSKL